MHQVSVLSASGSEDSGLFPCLSIICRFWGLFVMRPQCCPEVASVRVCAPGFYLFLVPLVGRASAWQVTQSPAEASQVDARPFLLRDLAHGCYLSLV